MRRPRKDHGANESHTKLFVGNLPCNASEQELYYLFAPFGAITEIHCLGASGSQSGQACAFVKFVSEQSGLAAVQHLNGKVALRPYENEALLLLVKPARSSHANNENSYTSHYGDSNSSRMAYPVFEAPRLLIGKLPLDTSVNELNAFFSAAGIRLIESETVILHEVEKDENTRRATVAPWLMEDAQRAIMLLDGRRSLRSNGPCLQVTTASEKYTTPSIPSGMPTMNLYSTRNYLLPSPHQTAWAPDAAFKTYHQYMMMPQSSQYGAFAIAHGMEPWRSSGIYSLPAPTFTRPF